MTTTRRGKGEKIEMIGQAVFVLLYHYYYYCLWRGGKEIHKWAQERGSGRKDHFVSSAPPPVAAAGWAAGDSSSFLNGESNSISSCPRLHSLHFWVFASFHSPPPRSLSLFHGLSLLSSLLLIEGVTGEDGCFHHAYTIGSSVNKRERVWKSL